MHLVVFILSQQILCVHEISALSREALWPTQARFILEQFSLKLFREKRISKVSEIDLPKKFRTFDSNFRTLASTEVWLKLSFWAGSHYLCHIQVSLRITFTNIEECDCQGWVNTDPKKIQSAWWAFFLLEDEPKFACEPFHSGNVLLQHFGEC